MFIHAPHDAATARMGEDELGSDAAAERLEQLDQRKARDGLRLERDEGQLPHVAF